MKRIFSGIMLTLLLVSMLRLAFNTQPVMGWTGTVYIRADGSIDPPDAPIQRDGNVYTLTGNITSSADGIVVERDNIIIDGKGYIIEGADVLGSRGIDISGRNNVTIKNTNIKNFSCGIYLRYSSNNTISRNNITNNGAGICITYSSNNNTLVENHISKNNYNGLYLLKTSNNYIANNTFLEDGLMVIKSHGNIVEDNWVNNKPLIYLEEVSNCSINRDCGQVILVKCNRIRVENLNLSNTDIGVQLSQTNNTEIIGNTFTRNDRAGIMVYRSYLNGLFINDVTNNSVGIELAYSSNNTIAENNIAENKFYGFWVYNSSNNRIYHNNFANNTRQIYDQSWDVPGLFTSSVNVWDNGYPSGGNYWSDYNGSDLYHGSYQNETGKDGIGDTPYFIDENNTDNYPLMHPYGVNLVANPSFEVDKYPIDGFPDCWTLIINYPTTYYLDANEHVFGNTSLKMEIYCHPGYYAGTGAASKFFHVKPNTTYTASFYVKTDRPDNNSALLNSWEYAVNGTFLGQHYQYFPISNSWQRINFTFTTYPTTFMMKFSFSVRPFFNETVTEWKTGEMVTAWIDGCQLEEGDRAKAFNIYFDVRWPYDNTGDGYCGIDDIIAVAEHFGTQPPYPEWNQIHDVNCDWYVGIDDVVETAEHFGEEEPP